ADLVGKAERLRAAAQRLGHFLLESGVRVDDEPLLRRILVVKWSRFTVGRSFGGGFRGLGFRFRFRFSRCLVILFFRRGLFSPVLFHVFVGQMLVDVHSNTAFIW